MTPIGASAGQARKALVVGAGVGGLTTAILLAKNGYQVLVVEKNSSPGGRCQRLCHQGHTFDVVNTNHSES